jgi:hypothetical protein
MFELDLERKRNRRGKRKGNPKPRKTPTQPNSPNSRPSPVCFRASSPGPLQSRVPGPLSLAPGPLRNSPALEPSSPAPSACQPGPARQPAIPLTFWPHWPEPSPSSAQEPRRDAAPLFHAEAAARCPVDRLNPVAPPTSHPSTLRPSRNFTPSRITRNRLRDPLSPQSNARPQSPRRPRRARLPRIPAVFN